MSKHIHVVRICVLSFSTNKYISTEKKKNKKTILKTFFYIDKWLKMVNITLGNEMWKVNCSGCHDLPNTERALYWATRTRGQQGHLTEFIGDKSQMIGITVIISF